MIKADLGIPQFSWTIIGSTKWRTNVGAQILKQPSKTSI